MANYTPIPIYVGARVVGEVRGTTFYKNIRGSRHILRTPRAIANDIEALARAEAAGATHVAITDIETGITYRSTIEHIRQAGFELDRGCGRQIALILDGWIKMRNGDISGEQLPLWQI